MMLPRTFSTAGVLVVLSLTGCASETQVEKQTGQLAMTVDRSGRSFEYTRDGQPISCKEYWKAYERAYVAEQPSAHFIGFDHLDQQCESKN